MHFNSNLALLVAALAPFALADELEADEVPEACRPICGPMVTLTNACEVHDRRKRDDHDDDNHDRLERECVCNNTSFDVREVAALCAACIAQNRGNNGTDDMDDIMSRCAFSSTTFEPQATTAVANITVSATRPPGVTVITTGGTTTTSTTSSAVTATGTPGQTAAPAAAPGRLAQGVAPLALVAAGVVGGAWLF